MDTSIIEDLPSGPLDDYRKQASFNWKNLKCVFEDPEYYKIKLDIWNTLERDPKFRRPDMQPTTENMKRQTAIQFHQYCKLINYRFHPPDLKNWAYKKKTKAMMTINESIAVCFPDISVKYAIGISLIQNALLTLGTERHKKIFEAVRDHKILACLALTEVAHGSNTKQMQTTATYDKHTQEFVINNPDFKSAKCWVGNVGKTCCLALLFAQLYTDGQCHGLHAFIVPIRDPKTLLPYPGIIVGDIGEKIGLNGIDNGFMIFQNYRIPRENLLNRTADVTPEGNYESSFSDPGKMLGAALENLSAGRVGIMMESVNNLICATTISVRYAAVRKQFGPTNEEVPILEYPLHQFRLFPYMAASAVFRIFAVAFLDDYLSAVEKTSNSNNTTRIESLSDVVSEIHAIVSASKPLVTWTTLHAIQESREACGGHGYLKAARLGDLRNSHDPCVTYEGDNNVLMQQTSNWLLRQWDSNEVKSPFETCAFLLHRDKVLAQRFARDNIYTQDFFRKSYEWLITYLVKTIHENQQGLMQNGHNKFEARNRTQVFKAAVLTKAYAEYLALRYYWKRIPTVDASLRPVLEKLGVLYGLSCLDKHLIYFYQGNFANGPEMINSVKEGILSMCSLLKPDAVAIIDALAPPDYVVNSILGNADGRLYDNLQREFFGNPVAMGRPDWWREIIIEDAPDPKLFSKI